MVVLAQKASTKPDQAQADDSFGAEVAISGDTIVVGASGEDGGGLGVNPTPDETSVNSGAAYVFFRTGATWEQQAYLKPMNAGAGGDGFGLSVAIAGDNLVVGAGGEDSSTTGTNSTPNEEAKDSGAAYFFQRSGSTWSPKAYLKSPYTKPSDDFGASVAVGTDLVCVGALYESSGSVGINTLPVYDGSGNYSGAVYCY